MYVYQFKVNLKAAFVGDFWPWHQDFSFWAKEDEMPAPRAITVGIFLDEVTEFNGPMYFIPGSHRSGCHDVDEAECAANPGEWHRHVAASLSHQTNPRKVAALAAQYGILAPKGQRGTVLFFDCNVIHASPGNISPLERRILFITYNSVTNIPKNSKRPGFLVNRNVSALNPLDSANLVSAVTSPQHILLRSGSKSAAELGILPATATVGRPEIPWTQTTTDMKHLNVKYWEYWATWTFVSLSVAPVVR